MEKKVLELGTDFINNLNDGNIFALKKQIEYQGEDSLFEKKLTTDLDKIIKKHRLKKDKVFYRTVPRINLEPGSGYKINGYATFVDCPTFAVAKNSQTQTVLKTIFPKGAHILEIPEDKKYYVTPRESCYYVTASKIMGNIHILEMVLYSQMDKLFTLDPEFYEDRLERLISGVLPSTRNFIGLSVPKLKFDLSKKDFNKIIKYLDEISEKDPDTESLEYLTYSTILNSCHEDTYYNVIFRKKIILSLDRLEVRNNDLGEPYYFFY